MSSRERLPPGQRAVERMPINHLGEPPRGALGDWTLEIGGAVAQPATISWAEFQMMPMREQRADFHAASGWSALDVLWRGVELRALAERVRLRPSARFVHFRDHQVYETTLAIEDALDETVMLAHLLNDEPLSRERGGPVRLVVPRKLGWKSIKWVRRIEFAAQPGADFWQRRGARADADPWAAP